MTSSTTKPYDVGILGWWYGKNYGSILTYYGLNRAITGLGRRVLMIHEALGYSAYRVQWPDDMLSMQFARRVGYDCTAQEHHSRLPALAEKVDTFVVGSDQLWNPLIGRVDDDLFLDFVPPGCRRVAYATSFGNSGTGKFKRDFIARHAPNLQKFDALSVREDYAVRTAADVFGVRADLVVDPVFLLPRAAYDTLAAQATFPMPADDYLAAFFLDPTPEKIAVAMAIADKLGLQRILVVPNPDDGRRTEVPLPEGARFGDGRFARMAEDAPENFLQAYAQARYVVTDSFHGTAFAVIFGKPFSSIYNTKRGVDRFKNLMAALGFGDSRRVYETDTPETIRNTPGVSFDIDFTAAERHIATGRETSLRWLAAALSPEGEGQGEGTGGFTAIRGKGPSLAIGKDHVRAWDSGTVEAPAFTGANDAWDIAAGPDGTQLTVRPGCAVRGNPAWCELPMSLSKGSAYRLAVTWTPHTTAPVVNLHVRNGLTGAFRVVGSLAMPGRRLGQRTDTVDFAVADEGFTQFSLGAVHFTGPDAGAEIARLTVQEIAQIKVTKSPHNERQGSKGLLNEMKLGDTDLFARAHAQIGRPIVVPQPGAPRTSRPAAPHTAHHAQDTQREDARNIRSFIRDTLTASDTQTVPLHFKADNTSWKIDRNGDTCILTVVSGAGEKGNLTYCDLPEPIVAGIKYRITIEWEISTESHIVSVNIRNPESSEFRLAGSIAVGEKKQVRRTDEIDFSVEKAGFRQVMFGATQMTGEHPALSIHGISIRKAPTDQIKVDLAVPSSTRTFEQVIKEVSGDPAVCAFYEHLRILNPAIELHKAKLLKEYTWNAVGGPADILAFPQTAKQLVQLVREASEKGFPVTILGLCTNLLVRDGGIRGLVISTKKLADVRLVNDILTVGAGAGLTETAFFLQERGKSGLEWTAGIPGTVGGAVFMNAGTNISDIRRCIESVTFLDGDMNLRTLNVAEISWGKRYSSFQDNKDWIILEAAFRVGDGDRDAIRDDMFQTIDKRARHFPLDFPNHGSTFKWWRAPRLIAQSGLVGYRIGGAQISTKQPGFFVNLGDATASDFEALLNYTIAKVYEFSGFLMEPEVEVIGERLHLYDRYSVVRRSEEVSGLDIR